MFGETTNENARFIIAKTDPEDRWKWLPLHYHLMDTAGIMARLVNNWLSPAVRQILAGAMDEETLYKISQFLALVHDLGKATPAFQQKVTPLVDSIMEWQEGAGLVIPALPNAKDSPHALAGEALLCHMGIPPGIASIVGSHHGRPVSLSSDLELDQLELHRVNYWGTRGNDTWQRVQETIMTWALSRSGFTAISQLPELPLSAQMLMTGLLIMADWIASCTRYFPLISTDGSIPPYDEARVDAAWVRLNLRPGWVPEDCPPLEVLCRERFGFDPNLLQRYVMDIVSQASRPGILVIEAQMGQGKTEAALLAAELMSDGANGLPCRGGIFFGLPTQATADGIFSRVMEWGRRQAEYAPATIRLAHGAAELNEDYASLMKNSGPAACIETDAWDEGGMQVHEWFRGRKQALLSDFVVGTVDQLLMLALKQKHVMLRHLGLCGKVAIIDECHAYDAYMSQYLEAALQWLGTYGVPVILLSATLPCQRRAALIDAYLGLRHVSNDASWRHCRDYPLLTWTDGGKVCQKTPSSVTPGISVSIRCLPDAPDDDSESAMLAEQLTNVLGKGGCVGVIVNTVRRAQVFARKLRARLSDCEVLLLHAQYVQPHRADLERALLRRVGPSSTKMERERLIVVGTQVCEQSLDLDFDLLATDLCPMDLLLQRLGRLHRHRSHDSDRPEPLKRPKCLVMGAGAALHGGSVAIYGEYLLLRTRAMLPEFIVLPDDIPKLVQDVYDDSIPLDAPPEGYDLIREKHHTSMRKRRNNAKTFCLKPSRISKTLDGLLDAGIDTDAQGQAAVRDGDPSIEVIVLQRDGVSFRPVYGDIETFYYTDHVPDEWGCRQIARQKMRLPHALCVPHMVGQVIDALSRKREMIAEWLQSPWLRGQLYLLLDENAETTLCDKRLRYDPEYGLTCEEESHATH